MLPPPGLESPTLNSTVRMSVYVIPVINQKCYYNTRYPIEKILPSEFSQYSWLFNIIDIISGIAPIPAGKSILYLIFPPVCNLWMTSALLSNIVILAEFVCKYFIEYSLKKMVTKDVPDQELYPAQISLLNCLVQLLQEV